MTPFELAKVFDPHQQLMLYRIVEFGDRFCAGCQQLKAFDLVNEVEELALGATEVLRVDVAEGGETVVIVCTPETYEEGKEHEDSAD